jgi:hypothetical protein
MTEHVSDRKRPVRVREAASRTGRAHGADMTTQVVVVAGATHERGEVFDFVGDFEPDTFGDRVARTDRR